jgi:hypothetical protein
MPTETIHGPDVSTNRTTCGQVWHAIEKASFAVISEVTAQGEPRSSGVVYRTLDRRMYVAVAPDSWKAKHVAAHGRVAVTVTVRRGGLLSLLFPIPPATVSFHATANVLPADSPGGRKILEKLRRLLPEERRSKAAIIEIVPEGEYLTYGIGVPLMKMRDPAVARDRVPVEVVTR